ncbi:MAG: universal stress protein [Nitrospirae bacterium]|nr:universal stress protein [Nitrospirota bacterium]
MGRYRKLLVAVDGSESAFHALRQSFKLATNEKSWITVVSVVPLFEGDLELVGVKDIKTLLRQPCEKALSAAADIAGTERALIKTVCEEGEIYERIVDLADAENCDLIVMGRKDARHLDTSLVGSVTARVIGHSRRDVLVVPDNSSLGWETILVATDGSRYSQAAADSAIKFAQSYGGQLKIVSVVDVPAEFYAEAPNAVDDMIRKAKEYVKGIKLRAESAGIEADSFVGEGEAHQVITDLAGKEKANVIIMSSHGRTGLKRLLMGSVAEKVIGRSRCPVLVVRT